MRVVRHEKSVINSGFAWPPILELVEWLLAVHVNVEVLIIVVAHNRFSGWDAVGVSNVRFAYALAGPAGVGA